MPYEKLRRSGRISKQVPISLIGSDATGTVFTEETNTVVLSLHGAGIVSRHKLLAEQELTLRSLESGREADIRVVGEIGTQDTMHTYGVAFRDEQLDFWQIEFPSPPDEEERPPLFLQCGSCHSPITIENGDFEFDVCTIHGGLVRYCDQCSFATVWKMASSGGSAKAKAPGFVPSKPTHLLESEEAHAPVAVMERPREVPAKVELAADSSEIVFESLAETVAKLPSERRLHGRAKVNYYACVRSEAFGDDIVQCVDMSRGGLCFRTKNSYLLYTVVRVAVPFSREYPQAPAIFLPAKIVSVNKIPGTDLHRCGIAFFRGNS